MRPGVCRLTKGVETGAVARILILDGMVGPKAVRLLQGSRLLWARTDGATKGDW